VSSREHLRCPVCGKISRGASFAVGQDPGHRLEVLTQHFVGGRGPGYGFFWSREAADRSYLEVLEEVCRNVTNRLRGMLGLPPLVEQRHGALRPELQVRPVVALRPEVCIRPSVVWEDGDG